MAVEVLAALAQVPFLPYSPCRLSVDNVEFDRCFVHLIFNLMNKK